MSPLYLHNGKLLLVEGALATSEKCCCGGNGMCISPVSVGALNSVNPPFCEEGIIWYTSSNKLCFTCTPVGNDNCPSCDDVQIPFPLTLPTSSIIQDCNNACRLSDIWSIGYNLKSLTLQQKEAAQIEGVKSPSMTVLVDANFIDTNYPQEDGWILYYAEEGVTREKREYDCSYSTNALLCLAHNTSIRIFAIKDCSYPNGGTLAEITDDAITGSTSSTTGAIQVSKNNWAWISVSEIDDCSYPSLFNIADLLSVECFDTNFNCATGEPY